MNVCLTCGMVYSEGTEIIQARDPMLKRGAIHILIPRGSKSFMTSYSAPYHIEIHPLFPTSPEKRIQAILEMAELTREADILRN